MIPVFGAFAPPPVPRRVSCRIFARPYPATIDALNFQCYTIQVPVVSLDVRRSLWRDSGNTHGTFATITEGGAAYGSRYCNNYFICNISSFEVAYYSSSIRMAHPPKVLMLRFFVAFFVPSITPFCMDSRMALFAKGNQVALIVCASLG